LSQSGISGRELVIVCLLLFLSVALRCYHLGEESIWYDEAVSIKMAGAPATQVISGQVHDAGNPPLYYFLLRHWLKLLQSQSESSARSLSAVFGVLGVLSLYWIGRAWFGAKVAVIAALILALSPAHIELSQEARCYALAIFLTIISFYYLEKLKHSNKAPDYVLYLLSTLSLIYSHYYGLVALFVQFIYLNLPGAGSGRGRFWRNWIFLLLVVLYAPWLPVLLSQMSASVSRSEETWYLHALALPYYLTVGRTLAWRDAGLTGFALAESAVLLVIAFPAWKGAGAFLQRTPLILFWLLGIFTVALLISITITPLFNTRYLSLILPAFAWILGSGLLQIWGQKKWLGQAEFLIIAVLVAISLFKMFTARQKEDWRSVAAYIEAHRNVEEAVLLYPGYFDLPFRYYDHEQTKLFPLLASPADDRLRTHPGGMVVQDDIAALRGAWLVRGVASRSWEASGYQNNLERIFPHCEQREFCRLKLLHFWK